MYHGGSVPIVGPDTSTRDPFDSGGFQTVPTDLGQQEPVEVTFGREPSRPRKNVVTFTATRRTTRPTRTTRRATSRRRASATRRAVARASASRDDGGSEPGPSSPALPEWVERSAEAVAR